MDNHETIASPGPADLIRNLTCQLVWEHFQANKWEGLCKDPAVTPQETGDPNLLFPFSPRHLSPGIDSALITASSPQTDVSWKDRRCRRVAFERLVVVPGKEADGGEPYRHVG